MITTEKLYRVPGALYPTHEAAIAAGWESTEKGVWLGGVAENGYTLTLPFIALTAQLPSEKLLQAFLSSSPLLKKIQQLSIAGMLNPRWVRRSPSVSPNGDVKIVPEDNENGFSLLVDGAEVPAAVAGMIYRQSTETYPGIGVDVYHAWYRPYPGSGDMIYQNELIGTAFAENHYTHYTYPVVMSELTGETVDRGIWPGVHGMACDND